MTYSKNDKLEKVYAAFGIQLPYVGASVFARHVDIGVGPILDAGCGTGMHSLPLRLMGYNDFHGIDLSEGMIEIARLRNIYESLQVMALGSPLGFEDNQFAITYSIGCLAPGNAPPNSLDEFIRVTQPGGLIIWSTHGHVNDQTQPYHDHRAKLAEEKLWNLEFETPPFTSMPNGDPNIKHVVYVYRVS